MGFPPTTEAQGEHLEKISKIDFDSQQKVKDYTQSEINRIIFYLSTGTFVLSISFIGYFKNGLLFPYLLILSWICFALAIAGQIAVHTLSKWIADMKQTLINRSRNAGFKDNWQKTEDDNITKWLKWGGALDIVILSLLAAGILSLLIFGAGNLLNQSHERQINNGDGHFSPYRDHRGWQR